MRPTLKNSNMPLRDHILVQKNVIAPGALAEFHQYLRRAPMTDSLVSDFENESDATVEWVVNKRVRDTQEVQLTAAVSAKLNDIVQSSVSQFINPFYGVQVRDWEAVHILHYGVGGHYTAHVDAETLYKDEDGRDYWEKTLDRDLSIVYFLNDDFEGGELKFSELDVRVAPQAGTLVCFPSDHNYIHGVVPVTSGHRYSIVTWLRVIGTPSVDEINRQTMDEFNRAWPASVSQPPRFMKRR